MSNKDSFRIASMASGYSIAKDLARRAGGDTWEAYKRAYPVGMRGVSDFTPELKKK